MFTQPGPSSVRASRLAIASFVLGVLGWLCAALLVASIPLLGLPTRLPIILVFLGLVAGALAVMLGSIGLDRIRKSQGKLDGTDLAKAGLLMGWVSVFSTAIRLVMVMEMLPEAREGERAGLETRCANNVEQLGRAIYAYSADYGGFLPCDPRGPLYSLSVLYPRYADVPDMFVCPSRSGSAPPFPPACSLAGKPCSYGYDNETSARALIATACCSTSGAIASRCPRAKAARGPAAP